MATTSKTKTATTGEIPEIPIEAMQDMVATATNQYFSLLEKSQAAALEGYESLVEVFAGIDMPAVPGSDAISPLIDATKPKADAFDGLFDFAGKLLDSQRQFARDLLAVGAKG